MKYGIYYAYWDKEWGGDFIKYISKVKKLGYDILEVACGDFHTKSKKDFKKLKKIADTEGIILTGGYGPRPEHNIASTDKSLIKNAFKFWADVFKKMEIAGIDRIGGALYSYWPVDYSQVIDKQADFERSVIRMRVLADMAADHGITLNMEALNRFEGYMMNVAKEAIDYVNSVDRPNVKILLDTFHMNIEEDSILEAIESVGPLLGHLHVGEADRKPPYAGGRMPWREIGESLEAIDYQGYVVLEPFVMPLGKIGKDIHVWRNIFEDISEEYLDKKAAESVSFLRKLWD